MPPSLCAAAAGRPGSRPSNAANPASASTIKKNPRYGRRRIRESFRRGERAPRPGRRARQDPALRLRIKLILRTENPEEYRAPGQHAGEVAGACPWARIDTPLQQYSRPSLPPPLLSTRTKLIEVVLCVFWHGMLKVNISCYDAKNVLTSR